ncbi:MAG TPA: hypothetical protein VF809_02500, partial [Candidatus Saccharimonadales bacterium]
HPTLPETLPQPLDLSPDILDGYICLSPEEQTTDSPDGLPLARVASLATTQEVALDLSEQPLTLKEKFLRSRIGRAALTGLAALGLAAGGVAVEASPAIAASNPVYTVTNHDNDGTNGIYYRNSTSMADSIRQLPYYARYGDRIELICGTNGEAVGQYGNKRWHLVRDLDNPKAPNQFYIPDHDTNTPNRANRPTVGERECGGGTAADPTQKQGKAYPDNSRRVVYFQPRLVDLHDPRSTQNVPASYTMVAERGHSKSWTGEGTCSKANARNFLSSPAGKSANTLAGFSIGRIGVLNALISMTDAERANIDYVILYDPGNAEDFAGPCGPVDGAVALNDWLSQRESNRLVIISGRRTGENGHAGIQNNLFGVIKADGNRDQVVVCNNSGLGHEDTWNRYKVLM